MQTFFENLLTASLYGSVIIAALLLLRPLLKKVPKKYLCLLWLLAFLRLLIPFEIPFDLSLQPNVEALTRPQAVVQPTVSDLPEPVPAVPEDAVLPPDTEVIYGDAFTPPDNIPEGLENYYPPAEGASGPLVIDWNRIGFVIWAIVACALTAYSLISYAALKRRVREAVRSRDGVWECAGLETAFILGWVRPRVYLPMGLSADTRHHILRHERAHLQRRDHWLKLLGFLALTVHWFNPLVWTAWVLLCRDMELACDEQVVKDMGLAERKDYSAALLRCSTAKEHYLVCPVAFGEVSVKQRILSVLNYRRPRFWISLVGIVAIVFVAVFFMTSPAKEEPDLSFLNYKNAVSLAAEQKKVMTVYYLDNKICPAEVYGDDLAKLLDTADWKERQTVPGDQSSPGSVDFLLEDGYDISLFDRGFARVKYGEEVRYYRIPKADYEAAVRLVTDPAEKELTEEEILIERCKSALEAVMYADCYHIAVDMNYTGPGFLQNHLEAEYWKYHDNHLSRHYPDSDTATSWLMEWNGDRYKRLDCATWVSPDLQPYDWTETEFDEVDESRILPWFHHVDWNRDSFAVQHHTPAADAEEIILEHCTTDDFGDEYKWLMTFRLDGEGNLLSIDRSLTEFGGKPSSGTVTTRFISFDEHHTAEHFTSIVDNCRAICDKESQTHHQDAHHGTTAGQPQLTDQAALLQRCFDALAWHQMQDWRHLRMHVFYAGDLASETELTAEYWQTPVNSLRKLQLNDGAHDPGWLVKKNGTIYCLGIKPYYPEDITDYTAWVEAVNTEEDVMTTWLEEYRWDFTQIEFLRSQEQGDRTVITFRVNEPIVDNMGASADYHDVTFWVDEDNILRWASDNYTILGTQDGDAYGYMVHGEIQVLSYNQNTIPKEADKIMEELPFPY